MPQTCQDAVSVFKSCAVWGIQSHKAKKQETQILPILVCFSGLSLPPFVCLVTLHYLHGLKNIGPYFMGVLVYGLFRHVPLSSVSFVSASSNTW